MTTPSNPNFRSGVGRLVTDRFDFQGHIEGTSFKHTSSQIDLSPPITIDGYSTSNVNEALIRLAAAVSTPDIPDATSSVKGLVKLNLDLGGTADIVKVTGLQGRAINTLPPNTNDVLTWNGVSWGPALPNSFVAAGDLTGSNTLQQVISVTGSGGFADFTCGVIRFASNVVVGLQQVNEASTDGRAFNISGQSTTNAGGHGGNVIIGGGAKGAGGLNGGVFLTLAGTSRPIQMTEIATNRQVVSFCHEANLTLTDMPADTGNLVMYIRDAATAPASGNPSGGSILYSSGGALWIKQSDGTNFQIEPLSDPFTLSNPFYFGDNQEQITYQTNTISPTGVTPTLSMTLPLSDNTATYVEALFVGKEDGTNRGAMYKMAIGYTRTGGSSPAAIGTTTSTDPRASAGGGVSWVVPTLTTSGNNLLVKTGANDQGDVSWTVTVRLTLSAF